MYTREHTFYLMSFDSKFEYSFFLIHQNSIGKTQNDKKKYFRRGDLLAQEKETYLEQQGKQNENASTPEKSSDSREYHYH